MSLTQAEIALIEDEIEQLAGRSTLQRVLEPGERAVVLRLRATGATHFLQISTRRNATRLHFIDRKPEQPDEPSSFAMLLRKWLHGAPMRGVRQIRGDRVVELEFAVVDPRVERDETERPERTPAYLVAELAGRVGNIYLLDSERRVVGKQTAEAIASRNFPRGQRWEPPPAPPDPEAGREIRWDLETLDADAFLRSEAVAAHYDELRRKRRSDALRDRLESGLEHQLDRLERRIDHVEEDLEEVENADRYRKRAELLQSAYGRIDSGADMAEVPDFYDDEMPTVEIPLDPRKTLEENIDHYYHQANRYEEARERVETRLLESVELRDRVAETLERLRCDDLPRDPDALEQLEQKWIEEDLLPEPTPSTGHAENRADDRPYREFRADSGRRILVGKTAADNDTLTTKVARGRDIWLHARDWAGAHVVLRIHDRGESPRTQDLLDAATLAAHFSNGRNDTVVEVGYTRAKHVRKTGDLPPGRVFVSDEQTLAVEMEKCRVERLLETEQ